MHRILAITILVGMFFAAVFHLLIPSIEPENPLYNPVRFADLEGWVEDDHARALEAFQISCRRIVSYPDTRNMGDYGTALDWKPGCEKAFELDPVAAKSFFETNFTALSFIGEDTGLFTGYYAPLYQGSREKNETYDAPLYMVPNDLQAINLGDFDQRLKGRSIVGEVRDNKFVPYKERKEIDQGALENKNLELVWLEKTEETFFLQIQGSGFIELEDGEIMHLGYAQRNGRPYRAIGQYLIESGDVAREDMSLQAILDWITENPSEADELMWKNPSYVFFQERDTDKPVGSLGVGLTPGRSLAVDREFIPLGIPLWLETYQEIEATDQNIVKSPHLNRLVIAQDTGGAIKGKIRGDVYWGIGQEAEIKAGPMKDGGTYFLLVPKTVAQNLLTKPQGTI